MSSSPLGVVELYDASRFADNDAFNTQEWRDGPANSALHWADQRGQVLVNTWALTSSGEGGELDMRPPAAVDTNVWTRIAVFGPLSLSLRADGTPYRLRARMGGYSTTGASVDFRLTISDFGSIDRFVYEAPTDGVETYTGITGTSAAYLTPGSGNHFLNIDARTADACLVTRATLDDVSGSPVSVQVCEAYAVVWGKTANVAALPVCAGLYLAEFYPP